MKTRLAAVAAVLLLMASCGGATKPEPTPSPAATEKPAVVEATPTPAPTLAHVAAQPSVDIAIEGFRKVVISIPFGYRSSTVSLSDPKYVVEGQNMDLYMKKKVIPALVQVVKLLPADKKVIIHGHASAEGPESSSGNRKGNVALSEARAKAVLQYIIKNSAMDRNRFVIRAHGSSQPLPGESPNSPKNRRVVIDIE